MMFSSAVKYIMMTAALIMASIVIEGFTPEGGWDMEGPLQRGVGCSMGAPLFVH